MDIVEFLTARLDEMEADVQESRALSPDDIHWSMPDWLDRNYLLADIAAKRRILAEHTPTAQRGMWHELTQTYDTETVCATCVFTGDDEDAGGNRFRYREHAEWPCRTVFLLAAPFAGHPDFDPAWAVAMS